MLNKVIYALVRGESPILSIIVVLRHLRRALTRTNTSLEKLPSASDTPGAETRGKALTNIHTRQPKVIRRLLYQSIHIPLGT